MPALGVLPKPRTDQSWHESEPRASELGRPELGLEITAPGNPDCKYRYATASPYRRPTVDGPCEPSLASPSHQTTAHAPDSIAPVVGAARTEAQASQPGYYDYTSPVLSLAR